MSDNKFVGVILFDDSNMGLNHTYFSEILEGFKREIEKNDMELVFLNNDRFRDGAKTYAEQLKDFGCVGCIITCPGSSVECELDDVLNMGIPVAVIDRNYDKAICVSSDNAEGMEMLTDYVISKGHKKIAMVLGDDNPVTTERFNSFLRSCEKNHIKIPEEYILRGAFRNMNKAHENAETLLKLKNPPTCIMFSDDYSSIGGINLIYARGLMIPRDISITGFDGNEILAQYEPKLTTIKQDGAKMGIIAAEKMMEAIATGKDMSGDYRVEVFLEEGRTVREIFDTVD